MSGAALFVALLGSFLGPGTLGRVGRRRSGEGDGAGWALATAMAAAAVGAATAVGLVALQCGDGYYTAAYFHAPGETAAAATLGLALCHSFVIALVVHPAARSLGAAVGAVVVAAAAAREGHGGASSAPDTAPLI